MCQHIHMEELQREVENIVVSRGPFFWDFQGRLAYLLIRVGRLDLYSEVKASSYAFVASKTIS